MPFEFIQIPANGQGSAKEELNKLLRGGRIASVRKEYNHSHRDCVSKPKVGLRHEGLPWDLVHRVMINPTGVVSGACPFPATHPRPQPRWGWMDFNITPRTQGRPCRANPRLWDGIPTGLSCRGKTTLQS